MNLGLEDFVTLITGASGGIGWATAEAFAAEGSALALHAATREPELRARATEQWPDPGARRRVTTVSGDLREVAAADAMLGHTVQAHGRVDALIVNAGVWPSASRRLDGMDPSRVAEVLDLNLRGAIWCARAFMATLARVGPRDDGRGASLIFVGSTAGRFGEAGHAAYSASKAALTGLVRTLKNEITTIDPFARVNMVEPGWTATPMARPALDVPGAIESATRTMALRQIARPRDIARALLMLASPVLSRHITGEVLTVAGGMEGRTLWAPDDIDPAVVRGRLVDDD